MTSAEALHETIAKLRRRVREIDVLIAQLEAEDVSGGKTAIQQAAQRKSQLHLVITSRRRPRASSLLRQPAA